MLKKQLFSLNACFTKHKNDLFQLKLHLSKFKETLILFYFLEKMVQ